LGQGEAAAIVAVAVVAAAACHFRVVRQWQAIDNRQPTTTTSS